MREEVVKVCNNVYVHKLSEDKFKTSSLVGFFISKLDRATVTINTLVPEVLMRGTKNYNTMKEINDKLDNLYGATFEAGCDKVGDRQMMQFNLTTIDDKYAINGEPIINEAIKLLLDVIYNPLTDGDALHSEYVKQEKENLKELIKARINDKSSYATSKTIEKMFEDEAYGIYKYGEIKDLSKINAKNLYAQYKWLLKNSQVHFYICSTADIDMSLFDICKQYENKENINVEDSTIITLKENVNKIIEKQDVTQGKLVLGYRVDINEKEDLDKLQVYNAILGGSSNSKMFQNVREKESLAYTARSNYIKYKKAILVSAGIEIKNYEKALGIIKEQVEDMKKGNFTDEDIKDAKIFIQNIMRSYPDSQDAMIALSLTQTLMNTNDTIEEKIEKIEKVTREDILYVANKVTLDTEYFLTAKK